MGIAAQCLQGGAYMHFDHLRELPWFNGSKWPNETCVHMYDVSSDHVNVSETVCAQQVDCLTIRELSLWAC